MDFTQGILGASRVKMANRTEVRCDEIKPGDIDIAGYRIKCIVQTIVPYVDFVRLTGPLSPSGANEGGFTSQYRLYMPTGYSAAADHGPVERIEKETVVYTFVLEDDVMGRVIPSDGVLIVNGIMVSTIGDSDTLDELRQLPGWHTGHIIRRNP